MRIFTKYAKYDRYKPVSLPSVGGYSAQSRDAGLQHDIEQSLPSAKPTASLEGHPAVAELRQLMGQVEEIRKRRDGIEAQLKDVSCDISKIMSF